MKSEKGKGIQFIEVDQLIREYCEERKLPEEALTNKNPANGAFSKKSKAAPVVSEATKVIVEEELDDEELEEIDCMKKQGECSWPSSYEMGSEKRSSRWLTGEDSTFSIKEIEIYEVPSAGETGKEVEEDRETEEIETTIGIGKEQIEEEAATIAADLATSLVSARNPVHLVSLGRGTREIRGIEDRGATGRRGRARRRPSVLQLQPLRALCS
ncbi:unnamed protein product [Sphagnum balticum]